MLHPNCTVKQRFGYAHKADLPEAPRPASLPPIDDRGKLEMGPRRYENRVLGPKEAIEMYENIKT